MIPSKPLLYFKSIPVEPDGKVTMVDLGAELKELPLARRHSLPPSPTVTEYAHGPWPVRHGSIPPFEKPPKIKFPSHLDELIEEIDNEMNHSASDDLESVAVREPRPQSSKTPRVQVGPAEVS
jgi:hypothetical protein